MSPSSPNTRTFREDLLAYGVLQNDGQHQEFREGMHGQKLDFDVIERDSPLYREWVGINMAFIAEQFVPAPEVVLGVANGTNRLALDVACNFDGNLIGLKTAKDSEDHRSIYLPDFSRKVMRALRPELVVVLEDVGTTGSSSVQAAEAALDNGAQHVEVVVTWQRRSQLEKLQAAEIPYRSIIFEPLPTFEPADCASNPDGFCARGWELVPRSK